MKKIVVAVGGSSGSIYTKVLFDRLISLSSQIEKVGVVMSKNAKFNWELELKNEDYKNILANQELFQVYDNNDFMAPFASGSAKYESMIVCPCSMGLMGRIAVGISNDLVTRAADVILKERRRLILMIRDTPYSLIHINNMKTITEAGGIICPASPSFYSDPKDFEALAATVVDRVIDLAGLDMDSFRWGEENLGFKI
ncbi:MAG: 4-hydroxy-3-polyprenylbenzoate decarboxylase [Saprospiraceae bacterium]|jgi:4-hydroxy-3-polyprenylbenzoate decarboxylase